MPTVAWTKPRKKAGMTAVVFNIVRFFYSFAPLNIPGWLTLYFIKDIPFLMSGSTIKCIMIDDNSLGTTIVKVVGGFILKVSDRHMSYIKILTIIDCIPTTISAPRKILPVSSSVRGIGCKNSS
jgi:hypothetical protein